MPSQTRGSSNAMMVDENILHSPGYHHKRHSFSAVSLKITLVFVTIAAVIYLGLNHSGYPSLLFERSDDSDSFSGQKDDSAQGYLSPPPSREMTVQEINGSSSSNDTNLWPLQTPGSQSATEDMHHWSKDANSLDDVLKRATMEDNKTVIITTLNSAWTKPDSIFDLFLESFRIGEQTERLLNHLVIIALDQKAYYHCLHVHKHCYHLTTEGIDVSSELHYMSKDYLKMMWRRTDFLRTVLELGYNFVFTDADIMWLRDPFPRFYPNVDFQIACDYYRDNSTNLHNFPNGGFKYVRANNRTIEFYKFWNRGKDYFPGKNEQDVLNIIKFFPYIQEIGLEMRFLDTAYFGGFCEPSKDLNLVNTMHANCCFGMENKIHDIKMMIDDWKKYMAMQARGRKKKHMSWTGPRICR